AFFGRSWPVPAADGNSGAGEINNNRKSTRKPAMKTLSKILMTGVLGMTAVATVAADQPSHSKGTSARPAASAAARPAPVSHPAPARPAPAAPVSRPAPAPIHPTPAPAPSRPATPPPVNMPASHNPINMPAKPAVNSPVAGKPVNGPS